MAEEGKNRWVVLLNRSPKGPLTVDEVRALISEGVLRMNDIAYQVSGDGPKGDSEWKLLWQFPEFNRRQRAGDDNSKSPSGDRLEPTEIQIPDRRTGQDPEEIKRAAIADLPPELLDLRPENLLPKSTTVSLAPEPDEITATNAPTDSKPYELMDGGEASQRALTRTRVFASLVLGVVIFSFTAMRWLSRGPAISTNLERAPSQALKDPGRAEPRTMLIEGHGARRPPSQSGPRPNHAPNPVPRAAEGYIPPPPEPESPRDDRHEDRDPRDEQEEDEDRDRRPVPKQALKRPPAEEGTEGEDRDDSDRDSTKPPAKSVDGEAGDLRNAPVPPEEANEER